MEILRTFDLLDRLITKYPKEDALVGKKNGEWIYYSTKSYIEHVNYLSYGLLALGYKKGDKIASVSNNRPEWNFMDMAMSQIGVVHVPIYPTISDEEYRHILSHSAVKSIIVSNKNIYKNVKEPIASVESIKEIYCFDDFPDAISWTNILEKGKEQANTYKEELQEIKKTISPDDLLSIIYTSGTTGLSKGVMLTHKNMVTNAIATQERVNITNEDRVLSFLPLCHVYERMVNYTFHYLCVSVYYAEHFGTISDDAKRFKVSCFVTVPRVLEVIYDKIISKGKDLSGIKKSIFFWAIKLGLRYNFIREKMPLYKLELKIANKLVFRHWREALGGNIKCLISGGAALQPRLARIFWAAGIPVLEGYGLTETSPVIAVNSIKKADHKIGTVGPVINGVEVKIAKDDEILVKGPSVMKGYYKAPEITAEVIDEDGWFHTGDVGKLIKGKFLKITDRKKEIFKNSAGKYIAPQLIENKFKESDLIEQIMIVGEGEKFVSAIISPNFNYLHYYASKYKLHYRDNSRLIKHEMIIKRMQREVTEYNKELGQVEQVKRFRMVCEPWSNQTGELSPTLKLRRRFLYKKYETILREIYQYAEGEKNRAMKKM